jgi:hypothetical protein
VTGWLDSLRAALDARDEPVQLFFRDDDAGWDDDALELLLDVFEVDRTPLDVAAIPTALSPRTVDLLTSRRAAGRNDVTVHQHGLAHVNHEADGRKCEFGASRSPQQQAEDVARGRELLGELLGEALGDSSGGLPPVFTPPWNRCAPWTGEVLRDLGFAVLSRDASAGTLAVAGLQELPVTVDWFAKRRKVPVDRTGRGALLAQEAHGQGPVGVMLHHEVMDDHDRADLAELLALVSSHPAVSVAHLDDLALSTA